MLSGLFNGLDSAERVLMVLGIVLFFVLVFVLLYSLFKGRPTGQVYAAFLIPIAMIGYSRLQTISFEKDVAKLQFATDQLQDNPSDAAKRAEVKQALSNIAERAGSTGSADSVAVVANAQFAAGETKEATATLKKAEALNPTANAVVQLQQKLAVLSQLHAATEHAKAAPASPVARENLKELLARTATLKLANPDALAQVASAQAAAGQTAAAAVTAKTALTIAPEQPLALEVHRSMLRVAPAAQP